MDDDRRRLPPGATPYDPANGIRIGGFAGGALGALIAGLTGVHPLLAMIVGGVAGAAAGWASTRRANGDAG